MQHAPLNPASYVVRALSGKLRALVAGQSPVSVTCQIPDIQRLYAQIGLPARNGFFVEIGAFDGEQYSNTSFLADNGWRGLYVEPVPAFCKLIGFRHFLNDVSVERAAIGEEPGRRIIHTMGALSTMQDGVLDAYKATPWAIASVRTAREIEIRADTFAAVLSRHAVPESFDLMIVDVEGSEEPIISAMLASRWRPRALIVELCDGHPDFDRFPELQASHRGVRDRLTSHGYQQFYCDPINTVFVLSLADTR